MIFYTSGTTGRPKGAISTHRSMIANLQNTMYGAVAGGMVGGAALPDAGAGQNVSLFTSPLFHVSGCHSTLVVGLLAGLKLVMPEGRFTPETALELIQEHKVTVWATVPTMVWRVCEHPDRHEYDTSSVAVGRLRRLTVGRGAPADDPRHVPEREHHHERLRPHRDVVGGHRHRRVRTPSTSPRRSGRRCRRCR